MTIAALIVAAGTGSRLGAGRPKALVPLAGVPILARAASAFLDHPRIARVVAAVRSPDEARAALGPSLAARLTLVAGGPERQDSVRRGLEAVGDAGIVLVHDAARPLVTRRLIDAVIDATLRAGAAVPVVAVADTVKRLAPDGAIRDTLPREDLRLAQTPQGFRTDLLRAACARAERHGTRGTDDASLVESAGERVAVVEGSPRNIKITTPADLRLAEALLLAWPEGDDRA
jgi:2-C-methyl-D-erythritol 4-phosphate cytidylyltransferase